jgi:hypothetical protein
LAGPKGREKKEKRFLFIFRKYFCVRNKLDNSLKLRKIF